MREVPIAFTGNGPELRRHGRRDLLVNLVLGGLYTSVARRHAAEYLATHTTIAGTPITLVPVRKSRWPAIVLVLAFIAARVANELGHGPPLPLVIACGFVLLPYLWATVAARTIDAMHWGGLQLAFAARWREIYLACWPLLALGIAWTFAEPRVAAAVAAAGDPGPQWLAGIAAAAAFVLPLLALQAFQLRQLRFTRTHLGAWRVAWNARFAPYLRLWLLQSVALLVSAVLPVLLLRRAIFGSLSLQDMDPLQATLVYASALLLVLLLSTPARAWYEARIFVLTWNGIRAGDTVHVACALDVRAFVTMRCKDALRTFATLGRHRAESVVNAWRAKLAALTVRTAP